MASFAKKVGTYFDVKKRNLAKLIPGAADAASAIPAENYFLIKLDD
jgi:hypothetical protein